MHMQRKPEWTAAVEARVNSRVHWKAASGVRNVLLWGAKVQPLTDVSKMVRSMTRRKKTGNSSPLARTARGGVEGLRTATNPDIREVAPRKQVGDATANSSDPAVAALVMRNARLLDERDVLRQENVAFATENGLLRLAMQKAFGKRESLRCGK